MRKFLLTGVDFVEKRVNFPDKFDEQKEMEENPEKIDCSLSKLLGNTFTHMRVPTHDDLVRTLIELGVTDQRLIEAFRQTPRQDFVPDEHRHLAYLDIPIPIPHDQVTTQPSLIAKMIEALELTGSEKVLEIGTGHGFQTALLARLATEIVSIERWADTAETGRTNLQRSGIHNATVVVGDGSEGLAGMAPFDAILVSAAFPRVAEPLVAQLNEHGKLVQPIGLGGNETVILFTKERDKLIKRREVIFAHFVRLIGKHGFSDATRLPG